MCEWHLTKDGAPVVPAGQAAITVLAAWGTPGFQWYHYGTVHYAGDLGWSQSPMPDRWAYITSADAQSAPGARAVAIEVAARKVDKAVRGLDIDREHYVWEALEALRAALGPARPDVLVDEDEELGHALRYLRGRGWIRDRATLGWLDPETAADAECIPMWDTDGAVLRQITRDRELILCLLAAAGMCPEVGNGNSK